MLCMYEHREGFQYSDGGAIHGPSDGFNYPHPPGGNIIFCNNKLPPARGV